MIVLILLVHGVWGLEVGCHQILIFLSLSKSFTNEQCRQLIPVSCKSYANKRTSEFHFWSWYACLVKFLFGCSLWASWYMALGELGTKHHKCLPAEYFFHTFHVLLLPNLLLLSTMQPPPKKGSFNIGDMNHVQNPSSIIISHRYCNFSCQAGCFSVFYIIC